MDWAQQKFKCCEFKNKTVCINSCYADKDCKSNSTRYTKDCKDGFTDFVENNLVVIGAVALAIAFVQVRRSVYFKFLRLRKVYLESLTLSLRSVSL